MAEREPNGQGVFDFIAAYLKKDIYPFHMPGHKRNPAFLPKELLDMEITEFPGADNLLSPKGIILNVEKRFAEVFGADVSYLATNGSTGGVLAAVMAVSRPGGEVLVSRNCHKSVYSALVLSGMKPVYLFPEITERNLIGGITPAAVEKAFGDNPNMCAVVITSPTFEGFVSDIKAIADIAHKNGAALVVDEAHGASFAFSDKLPESAVRLGADIVVQSLHKRLPMLSQTSVIHVNKNGFCDPAVVKKCFCLVQTTSPSYVFLAQMDFCLQKLTEQGNILFEEYMDGVMELRGEIAAEMGGDKLLGLIGSERKGNSGIFDVDLSKLVIYINSPGLSGGRLESILADKYGIQAELSGVRHIIAMTSPADTKEGYDRLKRAVKGINASEELRNLTVSKPTPVVTPPNPKIAVTPREAFYNRSRLINLTDAAGAVSAGFIIPYPPGIPLVAPGEIITDEILSYIELCLDSGITVLGADAMIPVCC